MTREDSDLLEAFEHQSLPLEQWDQPTHVALAYLYLRQYSFDEALIRMRDGVKAFNAHHQIDDTPTSGYNETTTVAFLRIIATTMATYEQMFPTASSREFCDTHPQLLTKHVLRLFYSPEQRMNPKAKWEFVEPDLAPLPVSRSSG